MSTGNSTGLSTQIARPSRPLTGLLALLLLGGILLVDAAGSPPVDLFSAPPPLAFGSGQAPTGAHCTGG
ncbi:hypothetical protein [Roseicitreum antarcticum]|uniref:Uncharacterized protein n=1 Tax=Roseicitreum antarcticum TaxID=564137 RepID=A0A1H3D917_9RHOB|nr:hypothetical protein [Roseicitreum antarcticum]SDX62943.1 hypothetical protein SAMN04488238_11241 [Roseicitreum antarcticum]